MNSTTELYTIYLFFFCFALVFSWLINSLFLKFASTLGIRNHTDTVIRWSKTSKPALGGISFYILFLLSITCYSIFFGKSTILLNKQLLGFLGATTMAFLMGLSDDAYNTKPWLKFSVQVICALILISTGTYIHLFDNEYLNYAITMIWVVGIMNSVNMLDNMDSITTLVSICIISFAIYLRYAENDLNNVFIFPLIGVLGSLIGFLYFNWHPSKMFMGDTGSQFLGIILASMGIICFWNVQDADGNFIQTKQVIITALIFIIPICDTASVVINRIAHGRSPFIGGKDHTTHALFFTGITERRIAVLFTFLSMISVALCIWILNISEWNYIYITLFSAYFLVVFGSLFYIVRKKTK